MRKLVLLFPLLLVACHGLDESDYCASLGVPMGSPEYQNCVHYYFQQESLFRSDRAVCNLKADEVYPQSLYSYPYSYHVPGGFYMGAGAFGPHYGGWIDVPTDYQHNDEVDQLRMRIIEPCMQRLGWNSGSTWMAGRHSAASVRASKAKPLPWQPK